VTTKQRIFALLFLSHYQFTCNPEGAVSDVHTNGLTIDLVASICGVGKNKKNCLRYCQLHAALFKQLARTENKEY
jgi:hypothetical protein